MAAINPNDLAKFTGILEIRPAGTSWAYSRLASVRGLVANLDTSNVVEINADDTWTVLKVTNQITTIETELLEVFWRDTLALLFNWTPSDITATPVAITNEAVWTTVAAWTIYTFANKNGANTQVDSITVSDTGWALVLNTDYTVWVDANWFTYIVFLTATTGATTVDYTYTPNATETFTTENDTQELKNFELKITATDGGKDRTITVSSATLTSTYWLSFQDIIEANDITPASLTFTSNKWSTTSYVNSIL